MDQFPPIDLLLLRTERWEQTAQEKAIYDGVHGGATEGERSAGGGKDDDGDVGAAQSGEIASLGENSIFPLGEADEESILVRYLLQLYFLLALGGLLPLQHFLVASTSNDREFFHTLGHHTSIYIVK